MRSIHLYFVFGVMILTAPLAGAQPLSFFGAVVPSLVQSATKTTESNKAGLEDDEEDLEEEDEGVLCPPDGCPRKVNTFIIFFGFERSDITAEAAAVLNEAASVVVSGGAARMKVTGHTDTAESNSQDLSIRRARAAKATLIKYKVPADTITIDGKGDRQLMVDTPDGTREPQNRRATIDLE
jgi:outer membrane protein OmpA-like peptidoglycan-associated protein